MGEMHLNGTALHYARILAGKPMTDLATEAKISTSRLGDIERGFVEATMLERNALALALGMSVSSLCTGKRPSIPDSLFPTSLRGVEERTPRMFYEMIAKSAVGKTVVLHEVAVDAHGFVHAVYARKASESRAFCRMLYRGTVKREYESLNPVLVYEQAADLNAQPVLVDDLVYVAPFLSWVDMSSKEACVSVDRYALVNFGDFEVPENAVFPHMVELKPVVECDLTRVMVNLYMPDGKMLPCELTLRNHACATGNNQHVMDTYPTYGLLDSNTGA